MVRLLFLSLLAVCLLAASVSFSAEKLSFSTPIKFPPVFYLPMLAAEQDGTWKKNGLEAEWVVSRGTVDMLKGVVAKKIEAGLVDTAGMLPGVAGGVPIIIVAEEKPKPDFSFFVLPGSRIKVPGDLKGATLGVFRLGSIADFYMRAVAAALGLAVDRDVKIVAAGGAVEALAALKAGKIDVSTHSRTDVVELWLTGQLREVLKTSDYLPRNWVEDTVFARKDLVSDRPDTVKRVVRAVLQAIDYTRKNRDWTVATLKAQSGYSQKAAEWAYENVGFTNDGVIKKEDMQAVVDFAVKWGIVPKGKLPRVEELFTNKFISKN